jgi:hypothetical protein
MYNAIVRVIVLLSVSCLAVWGKPLGIKLTHSGYGNRSFMYHRDIPSM